MNWLKGEQEMTTGAWKMLRIYVEDMLEDAHMYGGESAAVWTPFADDSNYIENVSVCMERLA